MLPDIKFDNTTIEWVREYKYLGLNITNGLCFSLHIEKVAIRVSQFCGILFYLNKVLPRRILMMLYFAFILPHLLLHIEIWGSAPDCHIKTLIVKQNQLLRAILGVSFINGRPVLGTVELYKQCNVLTLKNIFKLQLFKFMVKLLKGEYPHFYEMLLRPHHVQHNYNTRSRVFRHPLITCEIGRRFLDYQLVILHEETPPDMYDEGSLRSALKRYKKFLLSSQ